ncbi:ABC-type spermidine/putrescine transport system, ATPase component [Paraburkholderia ribeironis]|uniref:ABC-type spermidine/putrescine transport system, ATPase component n=1 Tax=Paraburkholderia ribeironis TaxID=1247936 RepID=A0A1N7S1C5_9BURK|nr:ATP-binding cassette domain-containing protein [Paraburkholderia ribeironis]SIT41199.1 ABC-type spermidine/putrescine transport system, ATPase component [Paraburkholderia ribeironis]
MPPRSNALKHAAARPLLWLAALLAVYLCAPFVASVPQLDSADWANVDWHATWSAVGVSVASATVASLVILLGGVPLGYFLARSDSRRMALLGFVVQLPLALPPLTSGVLLLFLLGPYSLIGRFTGGVLTDSFTGIVLAQTFVAAPFLIIAAKSAFAAVDPVLDDVAATLGHHAGSRFFRVMLPVAWPAIRAGLALAWLRAFGEFGATVMVAYHPYSLPVYTYVVFGGQGLPAMMPLLLPTLAIAIVCAALSIYSLRPKPTLEQTSNGDDALEPGTDLTASQRDAIDRRLAFHLQRRLGAFDLDLAWTPATRRLAIIGPSGSGKSLALRLIAGLESNASSTVRLGATDLHALPPERRQIGYMPQDYGLFPHMSVARQLAFPVDADPASARYWLEHLGLAQLLGRLPHQLSFGQRQRVALARALTRHSELLLFDEPFAALDTPRRRRLQQSLRALQREIAAVTIIVTHDPDEAALLADEVLVVEQGRVLQAGFIDAVFERPATLRVAALLGLHNVGEGAISASGRLAIAQGLTLDTGASARGLAAGQRVMWRVSPHALAVTPNGAHAGVVDAVELRRGERYVRVNIAGVRFDIASDDASLRESAPCRVDIHARGVTVWPACGARQVSPA